MMSYAKSKNNLRVSGAERAAPSCVMLAMVASGLSVFVGVERAKGEENQCKVTMPVARIMSMVTYKTTTFDTYSHYTSTKKIFRLCWRREGWFRQSVSNVDCDSGIKAADVDNDEKWFMKRRSDGYWQISPKSDLGLCVNATNDGLSLKKCDETKDAQGFSYELKGKASPFSSDTTIEASYYKIKNKSGECVRPDGQIGAVSVVGHGEQSHFLAASTARCGDNQAEWFAVELSGESYSGATTPEEPQSDHEEHRRRVLLDRDLDGCFDALKMYGTCWKPEKCSTNTCNASQTCWKFNGGNHCFSYHTKLWYLNRQDDWSTIRDEYKYEMTSQGRTLKIAFDSGGGVKDFSCTARPDVLPDFSGNVPPSYLCYSTTGLTGAITWKTTDCSSDERSVTTNESPSDSYWGKNQARICYPKSWPFELQWFLNGPASTQEDNWIKTFADGDPDDWKNNYLVVKPE